MLQWLTPRRVVFLIAAWLALAVAGMNARRQPPGHQAPHFIGGSTWGVLFAVIALWPGGRKRPLKRPEASGPTGNPRGEPTHAPTGTDGSPLWGATTRNDADEIRLLLAGGADPNAAGAGGATPLHVATTYGHAAAKIASNSGSPAQRLHVATTYGHAAAVELLLAGGADPNRTDRHGNGPLWTAVYQACRTGRTDGNLEVVRLLVVAGADPGHKNHYGRSPRDSAEHGDQFIAGLLPRRGGRTESRAAPDRGLGSGPE